MKIKNFFKSIGDFFRNLNISKPLSVPMPGSSVYLNPNKDANIARDNGIQQSLDSANSAVKNWSDIAYGFLLGYADSHTEFMIEDMRNASVGFVPEPPSKRAWGGIAVRASKNKIIKRKGFQNVKNVKAHCTPATLWEVI